MKKNFLVIIIILKIFLLTMLGSGLKAQENCVLEPPVLHIDFSRDNQSVELNLLSLEDYNRVYNYCPQDGNYAFVSSTSDCFGGHWVTLYQDHTVNDIEGKMLVVNASYNPGLFFVSTFKDLAPNTNYEFAAWLMNICKPEYECTSIRPNLRFSLENTAGKELAKFSTGEIMPTGKATWVQYSAFFKTPAEVGTLVLKIENKANGGCGNDFAMDDITIRECVELKKLVKVDPKPVIKPTLPVKKPVVKGTPAVLKPQKKDVPLVSKIPAKEIGVISRPAPRQQPVISLPQPLLMRANPIIKQIVTPAAEIVIDLYDNGEIDGDTVTIYHNNVLIVPRAGLSEKAVTFKLVVDEMHPHHELVMVANNLGSIPPNTSLMIITAMNKRYEVFISSSEQKNAKIVIDLKSP